MGQDTAFSPDGEEKLTETLSQAEPNHTGTGQSRQRKEEAATLVHPRRQRQDQI
ncbi:unnamed protein product [Brassica rapa]|uniref:Uncharacterized protein n=1 Tax=Brassica campestris TaxID=3711 RepID=A0A8D9D038_BRACM|nr:unnamed protein product [Brassica rapa]CAG7897384.1 unnamed protein product [Brassica rapa]